MPAHLPSAIPVLLAVSGVCLLVSFALLIIILIIIFSIKVDLFPASGYGETTIEHVKHLFLPGLALALGLCPILIRTLRTSILEAIQSDYVKTARSKGLAEQAVMSRHVLRNALIPTITLFGISIGGLMGGAVITEKVFALPGVGAATARTLGSYGLDTLGLVAAAPLPDHR